MCKYKVKEVCKEDHKNKNVTCMWYRHEKEQAVRVCTSLGGTGAQIPMRKNERGIWKTMTKLPECVKTFLELPSPRPVCLSDTHSPPPCPHTHPYFWESNKPRHVVSDLGECSLLGAEPLAGMQEGLRTECYPAFISFANSSHFVCYSRVCVSLQ